MFDHDQSEHSRQFSQQLGMAAALIVKCRPYQSFAMLCLKAWIEPAIRLKQIKFFIDYRGVPIGYVTWALFDVELERRYIHDNSFLLHNSDWREGDRPWILDFVVINGDGADVARDLRREFMRSKFLPNHKRVCWIKRNVGGPARKVHAIIRQST